METVILSIKTDKATKQEAEKLFDELGLDLTTAVNAFLKCAVREQAIPFDLKLDTPNKATRLAIEEGKKILSNPTRKACSSMEGLEKALDIGSIESPSPNHP